MSADQKNARPNANVRQVDGICERANARHGEAGARAVAGMAADSALALSQCRLVDEREHGSRSHEDDA